MKERRREKGVYHYDGGGLRFQVAISEDGDGWQLSARNDAAYKAMGEPEQAPKYRKKQEARAQAMALIDAAREHRRPVLSETVLSGLKSLVSRVEAGGAADTMGYDEEQMSADMRRDWASIQAACGWVHKFAQYRAHQRRKQTRASIGLSRAILQSDPSD